MKRGDRIQDEHGRYGWVIKVEGPDLTECRVLLDGHHRAISVAATRLMRGDEPHILTHRYSQELAWVRFVHGQFMLQRGDSQEMYYFEADAEWDHVPTPDVGKGDLVFFDSPKMWDYGLHELIDVPTPANFGVVARDWDGVNTDVQPVGATVHFTMLKHSLTTILPAGLSRALLEVDLDPVPERYRLVKRRAIAFPDKIIKPWTVHFNNE